MARLNVHVHVQKDDGTHEIFGPDDEVPGWAITQIKNPNVWDEAPTGDESDEQSGEIPPKAGPGASQQAWADYAASKGVEVHPDWKRDDIVAELEKLGHA
jgi:hypothetical protein